MSATDKTISHSVLNNCPIKPMHSVSCIIEWSELSQFSLSHHCNAMPWQNMDKAHHTALPHIFHRIILHTWCLSFPAGNACSVFFLRHYPCNVRKAKYGLLAHIPVHSVQTCDVHVLEKGNMENCHNTKLLYKSRSLQTRF